MRAASSVTDPAAASAAAIRPVISDSATLPARSAAGPREGAD
jgi:hypothetical protein